MQKFKYILILVLIKIIFFDTIFANSDELPQKVLVDYWHNWRSPTPLTLLEIPDAYDIIDVDFAVPTERDGSSMEFTPTPNIYSDPQIFINDIDSLQIRNKKVLISIGGANHPIHLDDSVDVNNFFYP